MKNKALYLLLVTGISLGTLSCKDKKENAVEPLEAQKAAVAGEEAVAYDINKEGSVIFWKGSKPTGQHQGTIGIQDGTIKASDQEIAAGIVIIDMSSIAVTDEGMDPADRTRLENHLKGTVEGKETDFFNVEKFPTAVFEVTGVIQENEEEFLQGNLTLKAETKNIEFPIQKEISQDELILKSEVFTIDRTDWNVNYGSKSVFDNLEDNFINDKIQLQIHLRATRT